MSGNGLVVLTSDWGLPTDFRFSFHWRRISFNRKVVKRAARPSRVIGPILKNACAIQHTSAPPPIFVLPESTADLVGCVFVLPKLGTEFFYPRSNSLEIIVV
tara:strand:+ start:3655 stop:3960 length:306 start_codon:yes stop_codon:yes gene_type:complete